MPFIPHTEEDLQAMLAVCGVNDVQALFDEIPETLRNADISAVPEAVSEMTLSRQMADRASADAGGLCFIGAGAYDHHVPAAVWQIATRGEFYSAYTPYQAEASQGTLQLLYEYQSMLCGLTGMDVANASLYDGASALAEAVLMAVRANRESKSARILMPATVHPAYRAAAAAICGHQGIVFDTLPYCADTGTTLVQSLAPYADLDIAALVIPQPNFFGCLEAVDELADWAHARGALVIGVVNPVALALLRPPGEWGGAGADIACGEGQPLGSPLASGGPYFGLMACREKYVRQLPGRIVGGTVDVDGRRGYTLTLQPREQHIRRSRATSNICTNQGLLVTAATIHMSLLGPEGLKRVATACWANTDSLVQQLTQLQSVRAVFTAPRFHEAVLRLPQPVDRVLEALAARGILGGYALGDDYPALADCLLVCATEARTGEDLRAYADALAETLARVGADTAIA